MSLMIVSFLVAYLLGSFPTAFLLARAKGLDIFSEGSGSMGAMNTLRNVDRRLGLVVLLVDVAKGALAVFLASVLFGGSLAAMLSACVGVVVGHAWSVFVSFRGGKALAAAFGAALVLFPWVALAALVVLSFFMIVLKDKASLAAVCAVALFPVVTALVLSLQGSSGSVFIWSVLGVVVFSLVILLKHLPDLLREFSKPPDPDV